MVVSGQRPHENPDNAPRYQAQTKKKSIFIRKYLFLKKIKKKHENPGNAPRCQALILKKTISTVHSKCSHTNAHTHIEHYDVIRGSLFMVLDIPEN